MEEKEEEKGSGTCGHKKAGTQTAWKGRWGPRTGFLSLALSFPVYPVGILLAPQNASLPIRLAPKKKARPLQGPWWENRSLQAGS